MRQLAEQLRQARMARALERLVLELGGAKGAERDRLRERLQQVILSDSGNPLLLQQVLPALPASVYFSVPRLLRVIAARCCSKGCWCFNPISWQRRQLIGGGFAEAV